MEARCSVVCGLAGVVFSSSCIMYTHQTTRTSRPACRSLSFWIYFERPQCRACAHAEAAFKRPVINKLPVALPMCFFYGHPKDGSDHHKRSWPWNPNSPNKGKTSLQVFLNIFWMSSEGGSKDLNAIKLDLHICIYHMLHIGKYNRANKQLLLLFYNEKVKSTANIYPCCMPSSFIDSNS
jgi:hypothetical protein